MSSSCARIGHGGASALARGNTLESFDLAAEIGVDMVEFDVRAWRGELVLAHTILHARAASNVRLAVALDHLAGARFAGIGLNVDVKHPGIEAAVLDALRDAGMLERSLISSQVAPVLDRIRRLAPPSRTAISVGGRVARLSRHWGGWREQVLRGLAGGRWDVLMVQHKLIDERLLAEVNDRRAKLYAWTVNQRTTLEQLRGLGIHGIATADPRLFSG
jgi:glycerophosphoryl diester phosphodiesterase